MAIHGSADGSSSPCPTRRLISAGVTRPRPCRIASAANFWMSLSVPIASRNSFSNCGSSSPSHSHIFSTSHRMSPAKGRPITPENVAIMPIMYAAATLPSRPCIVRFLMSRRM